MNDLICTVKEDNIRKVKKLIDEGVDINSVDESGYSSLMYAVKNKNEEIVKLLLKNGAKLDIIANDGMGAVTLAQTCPSVSIFFLIVDALHGIDCDS